MLHYGRRLGTQAIPIEDGQRVGECRWVRGRWAGGDHIERIANHVRDNEANQLTPTKRLRESPALHVRQVFANRVHLLNRRAASVQQFRHTLLVFERNSVGGRQQR